MSAERILRGLRDEGFQGRIVPIARLADLRKDVESLREKGLIDAAVHEAYLRDFKYVAPEPLPDARSIIVAAVPQPKLRIHFTWEGRDVPAIVPPTYANAWKVIDGVKGALARAAPGGKFERATLPSKTLAARTGLVKYGRNNITYLPDHGSFHRLVAFFTDLDLGTDHWQEREALPACKSCRLCMEACPASVIGEDRFLIRVERCLTWFNEMPSEKPFPAEYKKEWHNAIVGCMRCQDACPYDKKVRDWVVEGECFSAEDTAYLLHGDLSDERSKAMLVRLESCGLDLTIFPRNLKVLLDRPS